MTSQTVGSVTLNLNAFASISVNSLKASGQITLVSGAPNLFASQQFGLQSKVYGPFGVPCEVTITVTSGIVEYVVEENPYNNSTSGTVTTMTEAEILAAAVAGELTPGAFYRSSDSPYTLYYASTASTALPLNSPTHLGTMTYATMQAYPSPVTGWTADVSDLGNVVSRWRYSGSLWLPDKWQMIYVSTSNWGQTAYPGDATERVVLSVALPAKTLAYNGAQLHVILSYRRGGVATASAVTSRLEAGTSAGDLTGNPILVYTLNAGPALSGGAEVFATRISATSMQITGGGPNTTLGRYTGNQTTDVEAAFTTPDLDSAVLYLNFTVAVAAAGQWFEANMLQIDVR